MNELIIFSSSSYFFFTKIIMIIAITKYTKIKFLNFTYVSSIAIVYMVIIVFNREIVLVE